MPAAGAPAGLGRWTKLLVGIVGALLGGELFKLLRIDFGLGDLKVTFEDLIAAFVGSLLVIFVWRIIVKMRAKKVKKRLTLPPRISRNRSH